MCLVESNTTDFKKTDKYNDMISSFQCDLSLAKDGLCKLAVLDKLIKDQDSGLLRDIELLEELEYLLRSGRAEIYIKE